MIQILAQAAEILKSFRVWKLADGSWRCQAIDRKGFGITEDAPDPWQALTTAILKLKEGE